MQSQKVIELVEQFYTHYKGLLVEIEKLGAHEACKVLRAFNPSNSLFSAVMDQLETEIAKHVQAQKSDDSSPQKEEASQQ